METRRADSALPAQSGADAIASLQRRWHRRLFRFAVLFLGDEAKAVECAQQTLLELKRSTAGRSEFECTVRVFLTAQRVAEVFLASCRSHKGSEVSATRTDRDRSEPQGLSVVCWALAQLPADERLVVVLRHFEQIAFDEIAHIARQPTRTVKSQFRYGLLRLYEVLESAGLLQEESALAIAGSSDIVS